MRRYDLVSGILLILSIIDFALAAPVSAQEKQQEIADVAQIPKDVISVLGKRWEEDLGKLGEEFLKTGDNPVVSSDLHPSSGSAPSGLDGSGSTTNVVQPPAAPNLASSSPSSLATNPDPSSSGCLSKSSRGLWDRGGCWSAMFEGETWPGPDAVDHWSNKDAMKYYSKQQYNTFGPGGMGLDFGYTTPLLPSWIRKPDPRPSIDPDDDFDWNAWLDAPDPPPDPRPKLPPGPASSNSFGDAYWYKVDPEHPPSTSGYGPSPPSTMPEENEAVTPTSELDLSPQKEPEDDGLPEPPPSPKNEPVDLQAAIIAAKAKAKVPGTTRDHVMNAAQRELQPAERSLDPGE